MRLSVIIPAYNEEGRLPKTLGTIDRYLRAQDYDYEILVVNDGSSDDTAEVVRRLKSTFGNLELLDNAENHGKGFAVRQGMLKARGEWRLFMDADNSTSIEHVEKMWPEFQKGSHVVICSRDVEGAIIAQRQSFWRHHLGDLFNLIVQVVSGLWGIWDTQCGFKGFSGHAAMRIFSQATINQWAFDVEVLVIAKKLGYEIAEVPATWVNDRDSRVRLRGMITMLYEVVQVRVNILKNLYG